MSIESHSRLRRYALRALLLVVIVAAVFAIGSRLLVQEVTVVPVVRGKAVDSIPATARVRAAAQALLRAPADAVVESTALPVGRETLRVQAGQELFALRGDSVEDALARERIALDALNAVIAGGTPWDLQIANARELLRTNGELEKIGQYAAATLERDRRELESLEQRAASLREQWQAELARIGQLRRELLRTRDELLVRSPFDGIAVEQGALAGQAVQAGQVLARVLSEDKIVEVSLTEVDSYGLAPGQTVLMRFSGGGASLVRGHVGEVLPLADEVLRRRRITAVVDAELVKTLIAGQTGEASVIRAERDHALLIPFRALHGGRVYVLDASGKRLHSRAVKVGFVNLQWAEILDGLEEGDRVLLSQLPYVREGQRVRAKEAAAGGGTATQTDGAGAPASHSSDDASRSPIAVLRLSAPALHFSAVASVAAEPLFCRVAVLSAPAHAPVWAVC